MALKRLCSTTSFIHHVSLNVTNLERSVTFYKDVLGLEQLEVPLTLPGRKVAWFDLGSGQQLHLIESDESQVGEYEVDTRESHFAVAVDSIQDALDIAATIPGRKKDYGSSDAFEGQTFFADPNGHIIEANKPRRPVHGTA